MKATSKQKGGSGTASAIGVTPAASLMLSVVGIGNVPSFKNTKSIGRNRKTGKPRIFTNPKKKKWMEACISSFMSQLRGAYPTLENVMRGECPKLLPTASCLPLDDSLDWMIPGSQSVERVAKGLEGAIIVITPL